MTDKRPINVQSVNVYSTGLDGDTSTAVDTAVVCTETPHEGVCAKCQPWTSLTAGMFSLIAEGLAEGYVDEMGQFIFDLTPEGTAMAQEMLHTDAEAAALLTSFQEVLREVR